MTINPKYYGSVGIFDDLGDPPIKIVNPQYVKGPAGYAVPIHTLQEASYVFAPYVPIKFSVTFKYDKNYQEFSNVIDAQLPYRDFCFFCRDTLLKKRKRMRKGEQIFFIAEKEGNTANPNEWDWRDIEEIRCHEWCMLAHVGMHWFAKKYETSINYMPKAKKMGLSACADCDDSIDIFKKGVRWYEIGKGGVYHKHFARTSPSVAIHLCEHCFQSAAGDQFFASRDL